MGKVSTREGQKGSRTWEAGDIKSSRSNAAEGTSQIWVADDIHEALVAQKRAQGRTIRKITEKILRRALKLADPEA